VGTAIRRALTHSGAADNSDGEPDVQDPVFRVLRSRPDEHLGVGQIARLAGLRSGEVLRQLGHLAQDFELVTTETAEGLVYRLGSFKAFLGQQDHERNRRFAQVRSTIS
jgi:DNA (cytosine-5)-methyltransferase 1